MKPVWEEEWTLSDMNVRSGFAYVDFPDGRYIDGKVERLRLASAAPDMARLLLRLEHVPSDSGDDDWCVFCRRVANIPHADDCEWLRVMKKAGVR